MQGSANLNIMMKAARKAARSLVKDFREVENLQVSSKGAGDFVSRADIAAEKILNLAAPFSPFSSEILKDYNMIVITRTWTFAPGDKLFGE